PSEQIGKTPFVWSTDKQHRLIQLRVSDSIVALTQERLRNWRMLQYISGQNISNIEQEYQLQINQLQQRYEQAVQAKEQAIDSIANGLAELALAAGGSFSSQQPIPVTQVEETQPVASTTKADTKHPLVVITDEERSQCTNCKACYQQVSELFEPTTIIDDGKAKVVSRVIPGALEKIAVTDELLSRISRVADECDAEIIHFYAPARTEA
ncbi:MAG: ferredoxin, partial [Psychromonas sp.]